MSIASAATSDWGFFVGLLAALLMGLAQFWGEAVMLGFLKSFPSELVTGWGSGTGFAGVLGTLLWVVYRAGKVPTFIVYLSVGSLFYLNSVRKRFTNLKKEKELRDLDSKLIMMNPNTINSSEVITEATGNAIFSIKMISFAIRKVWWWAGNLGTVFFLEYCISVDFADRASLRHGKGDFFSTNSFIILSLCYQLGMFLSRSSLRY
jgi:battenin